MNIVTNFSSTGFTGNFSTTSGNYTITGTITTDGDKALKTMTCEIITTATNTKVGSASMYFASNDSGIQDAIMAAIKAARTAIDTDLDS